jgi:hypothetical protein
MTETFQSTSPSQGEETDTVFRLEQSEQDFNPLYNQPIPSVVSIRAGLLNGHLIAHVSIRRPRLHQEGRRLWISIR